MGSMFLMEFLVKLHQVHNSQDIRNKWLCYFCSKNMSPALVGGGAADSLDESVPPASP